MSELKIVDFIGMDLSWYGSDRDGNFAIFCTNGNGPIPQYVIDNMYIIDRIDSIVSSKSRCGKNIWKDYSKLGLFSYDWNNKTNRYERKGVMKTLVCESIKEDLRLIYGYLETNESEVFENSEFITI